MLQLLVELFEERKRCATQHFLSGLEHHTHVSHFFRRKTMGHHGALLQVLSHPFDDGLDGEYRQDSLGVVQYSVGQQQGSEIFSVQRANGMNPLALVQTVELIQGPNDDAVDLLEVLVEGHPAVQVRQARVVGKYPAHVLVFHQVAHRTHSVDFRNTALVLVRQGGKRYHR